jgi:hypothetical protein
MNNSGNSSKESQQTGETKLDLSLEDIEAMDKIDLNPQERARRITSILITQDPYDILCFCVHALPALIVDAPLKIHLIVKHLARYVYQYHYFIKNNR